MRNWIRVAGISKKVRDESCTLGTGHRPSGTAVPYHAAMSFTKWKNVFSGKRHGMGQHATENDTGFSTGRKRLEIIFPYNENIFPPIMHFLRAVDKLILSFAQWKHFWLMLSASLAHATQTV